VNGEDVALFKATYVTCGCLNLGKGGGDILAESPACVGQHHRAVDAMEKFRVDLLLPGSLFGG